MKRLTALILSLCVLIGAGSLGLNSVSAETNEIPFIYVVGFGSTIYRDNEDGTRETVFGGGLPEGALSGYIDEYKEVLLKAFITQDWAEFDDAVYTILDELYGETKLDNHGYPTDGSYSFKRSEADIRNTYAVNSKNPNDYQFYYDWRLDYYDLLPELRAYVQLVQSITGKQEYAICGRCEGANLLLAYMDTYKDPNLKKAIFYASASKGVTPITECLCGEFYLDAEAIERFIYDVNLDLNVDVLGMFTLTDQLLKEIVQMLTDTYGLDVACWAINNVYQEIYEDVLPRSMMNTFGSFPSFWGMVAADKYDKGKKLMFTGKEDEYADFIKKIDTFHYIVTVRQEDIIKEAQFRGTEVYDIVKYGKPHMPVTADADALSDRCCKVEDASFGAVTTDVNRSFTAAELEKIKAEGNIDYVSPQNNIDASKGVLKDTTWYIDNMLHGDFDYAADDELMFSMVDIPGFDIHSDSRFPQYLYYDSENDVLLIPEHSSGMPMSPVDTWKETTDTPAREIKPFFYFFYKIIVTVLKIITLPPRY